MSEPTLYQEIADSIRKEILSGSIKPGEILSPVRDLAVEWNCAPGTVQRAYHELSQTGLVVTHRGSGTKVADYSAIDRQRPLHRASLVNQVETFLLRTIKKGYRPGEIENAFILAMDRWHSISMEITPEQNTQLRFVGSHDPIVSLLNEQLMLRKPDFAMRTYFAGSLGGLISLVRGETDIAGCHLWDEESDSYNEPFVRRLLPGRKTALVRLVNRQLGLIIPTGNPLGFKSFADLDHTQVRFAFRQYGSGTRIWSDFLFRNLGLVPEHVSTDLIEYSTHTDVAQAIAQGRMDVGVGIQSAASVYGLDFIALTTESYDLVVPSEIWDNNAVQVILETLVSPEFHSRIESQVGYDATGAGNVIWVE